MLKTIMAVFRGGKVELLENVEVEEGTKALVTLIDSNDPQFWLDASQTSIDAVWNNSDDDVYEQLLQE